MPGKAGTASGTGSERNELIPVFIPLSVSIDALLFAGNSYFHLISSKLHLYGTLRR